jgi:hypothetical protein
MIVDIAGIVALEKGRFENEESRVKALLMVYLLRCRDLTLTGARGPHFYCRRGDNTSPR